MNSDSENESFTHAIETSTNTIPAKSKLKYESTYKTFIEWAQAKEIVGYTEDVLQTYFEELSAKFKSSTLWTFYSMLRTMLNVNHGVDIARYLKLRAFIKLQAEGYQPKKSRTFTSNEINRFLNEAPDNEYITTKVALIMGITGACRRHELSDLKFSNLKDLGSAVIVTVPDVKKKTTRKFTVTGRFYQIYKRYVTLRPSNADPWLFVNCRGAKPTWLKLGINQFGSMAKHMATWLKLPNPELYTGHCFRRSFATISNAKEDLPVSKFLEGWNSAPVSENSPSPEHDSKVHLLDDNKRNDVDDSSTTSSLLPEKSKVKYETSYKVFTDWQKHKNMTANTEDVFIAYFEELAIKMKSSTLFTQYSMLKIMFNINHDVDLGKYSKLRAFIKRHAEGYEPKKSKTFSSKEINRFISEAPDDEYLVMKVALTMGIMGACRRHELKDMKLENIEDLGTAALVTVPDTKIRKFAITGQFYQIYKKYVSLRPPIISEPWLFLHYKDGKCTTQKIGINQFGNMGKHIATYLKLPNPEMYTGHCFRRSSATVLDEGDRTLSALDPTGEWNQPSTSGNYAKYESESYTDYLLDPQIGYVGSTNFQQANSYVSYGHDSQDYKIDVTNTTLLNLDRMSDQRDLTPARLNSTLADNKCEDYKVDIANISQMTVPNYYMTQSSLENQLYSSGLINSTSEVGGYGDHLIGQTDPSHLRRITNSTVVSGDYNDSLRHTMGNQNNYLSSLENYVDDALEYKVDVTKLRLIKSPSRDEDIGRLEHQDSVNVGSNSVSESCVARPSSASASESCVEIMEHRDEEESDTDINMIETEDCIDLTLDTEADHNLSSTSSLIPEKSRTKYESTYKTFVAWQGSKETSFSEDTILTYFDELSSKVKSSTLWALYSMLRATININHGIDISKYTKLRAFIKRQAEGYRPKKSNTFTANDVNRFINEAPDSEYLATKVALIMGIMGACRRVELCQMKLSNLEDLGSALLVTIPDARKNVRRFTIVGRFYEIYKKYAKLRPPDYYKPWFFLNYRAGKCMTIKIGINKFGSMGKQIATYLKLPNPELYTGHSFRRSSFAVSLDADGNIIASKRRVVANYINHSFEHKVDDANSPHSFEHKLDDANSPMMSWIPEPEEAADDCVILEMDEPSTVIANETVSNLPAIENVSTNNLPTKSKSKYESTYRVFLDWQKSKKITAMTESVLLTYFAELASKRKSSTLWSHYSMLRTTLGMYHNVDVEKFMKLRAFIKRQAVGYRPKKSKTFTANDVNKFINEAPDSKYLATKVALIIGIMGACRRVELCQMKLSNLEDLGSAVLVTIPDNKTNVRRFTIVGRFYQIYKKYASLRPKNYHKPWFFVNYRAGKCLTIKIGINKFGSMGKQIANYLKLPDADMYTGHCFRRSSGAVLRDAGKDKRALELLGGWRSTSVIEDYVDSVEQQIDPAHASLISSISTSDHSVNDVNGGKDKPELEALVGMGFSSISENYVDSSLEHLIDPAEARLINTESIAKEYADSIDQSKVSVFLEPVSEWTSSSDAENNGSLEHQTNLSHAGLTGSASAKEHSIDNSAQIKIECFETSSSSNVDTIENITALNLSDELSSNRDNSSDHQIDSTRTISTNSTLDCSINDSTQIKVECPSATVLVDPGGHISASKSVERSSTVVDEEFIDDLIQNEIDRFNRSSSSISFDAEESENTIDMVSIRLKNNTPGDENSTDHLIQDKSDLPNDMLIESLSVNEKNVDHSLESDLESRNSIHFNSISASKERVDNSLEKELEDAIESISSTTPSPEHIIDLVVEDQTNLVSECVNPISLSKDIDNLLEYQETNFVSVSEVDFDDDILESETNLPTGTSIVVEVFADPFENIMDTDDISQNTMDVDDISQNTMDIDDISLTNPISSTESVDHLTEQEDSVFNTKTTNAISDTVEYFLERQESLADKSVMSPVLENVNNSSEHQNDQANKVVINSVTDDIHISSEHPADVADLSAINSVSDDNTGSLKHHEYLPTKSINFSSAFENYVQALLKTKRDNTSAGLDYNEDVQDDLLTSGSASPASSDNNDLDDNMESEESTMFYEEDYEELLMSVIPVDPPPKKKYKISSRKSSDGNDREVLVLKTITNTTYVPKEETLDLECVVDELSQIQKQRKLLFDKEQQEMETKLQDLIKGKNTEVVFKGELHSAFELNEFISKSNKALNALPQVSPNSDGTYQLVMDPRLGIIVGTMQKNQPAGQVSAQPATTPASTPAKATGGTYGKLQIASAVKAAATLPPQNQTLNNARGVRTRRSAGVPVAGTVTPAPASVLQAAPVASPQVTAPITRRSLQRNAVPTPPKPTTGLGKRTSALVVADKGANSNAKGVVDLTSTEERNMSQADTREISFSKLQGKTYPSLVVVARPQLRVTDLTSDRARLDAKVKSVLMHPATKFTEWLIQQGLVRSEQKCPVHSNNQLKLGMYSDATKFPFSGGYVWISECCPQRFISVFNGSLFEGSPNPPMVMLKLIYHWSCQTNIQNVTQWVKVDNLYVKGVFTWLRAICTVGLHTHIRQLGGPGSRIEVGVISLGTTSHDGNQRQVKVEVLGILETSTKFVRLRAVEPMAEGDRNFKKKFSKILEPILQWVHPSSVIVTDLTVDKSTLHNMGFMNVMQTTTNEYGNSNRTIMEYLRRIVPRMFQNTLSLLSRQIIQQFLDELVWREWFGITSAQAFDNIVAHLAEQTRSNTQQSLILKLNKVAANPFKHWNLSVTTAANPPPLSSLVTTTASPVSVQPQASVANQTTPKTTAAEAKRNARNRSKPNTPSQITNVTESSRPSKPISPDVPEQMVPLENYYYGTVEPTKEHSERVTLNVKCPFCKANFDNNLLLQNHLFKHAHNVSNDALLCNYCLTSVSTANELLQHVKTSHPTETRFDNGFACLICETRYMNPFVLGKHMSKEHSPLELPYECGTCGFRCSNHKQVIDHFNRKHDGGATIQCPFCLKSTTVFSAGRNISQNINYFLQHLQKHQRKQLAKRCGKCALWFVQKDLLKDHQTKMHSSVRGKPGLLAWTAPRNGVMVPKSKIDKHPGDAEVINFTSMYYNIPANSMCKECHKPIDSAKHFPAFSSCQIPNCQYSTCCANSMLTHTSKCKGLDFAVPNDKLLREMFCVCGYRDIFGNAMAKHLAVCEKKSAYPSQKSAKTATVTQSMLNILGLVRKPGETAPPSKVPTKREHSADSENDIERFKTEKPSRTKKMKLDNIFRKATESPSIKKTTNDIEAKSGEETTEKETTVKDSLSEDQGAPEVNNDVIEITNETNDVEEVLNEVEDVSNEVEEIGNEVEEVSNEVEVSNDVVEVLKEQNDVVEVSNKQNDVVDVSNEQNDVVEVSNEENYVEEVLKERTSVKEVSNEQNDVVEVSNDENDVAKASNEDGDVEQVHNEQEDITEVSTEQNDEAEVADETEPAEEANETRTRENVAHGSEGENDHRSEDENDTERNETGDVSTAPTIVEKMEIMENELNLSDSQIGESNEEVHNENEENRGEASSVLETPKGEATENLHDVALNDILDTANENSEMEVDDDISKIAETLMEAD